MNRIIFLTSIIYTTLFLISATIHVQLIETSHSVTATLTQNLDFKSSKSNTFLNHYETDSIHYKDAKPSSELLIFNEILFSPDIVNLVSVDDHVIIPDENYNEDVVINLKPNPQSIAISQYIKKYLSIAKHFIRPKQK